MNLEEFKHQLKSRPNPAVVDFWAPWCIPCRITRPILETLSKEFDGRVDLVLVNADENPELLRELGIFGIPTVLVTRAGEIIDTYTGAQTRHNYRKMFEALSDAGETVAISMSPTDRFIRLVTGTVLGFVGVNTDSWVLLVIGALIAFLGVYDRCPIWRAITTQFKKAP